MTTRESKRAVRLQEWGQMVKLCHESGLTVNEWCNQNGLKPACYYYRLSQVRKEIQNHNALMHQDHAMPTLVKVDVTSAEPQGSPGAKTSREQYFHLQYRSTVLDIPVGTNAEDIAEVLKAMGQHAF